MGKDVNTLRSIQLSDTGQEVAKPADNTISKSPRPEHLTLKKINNGVDTMSSKPQTDNSTTVTANNNVNPNTDKAKASTKNHHSSTINLVDDTALDPTPITLVNNINSPTIHLVENPSSKSETKQQYSFPTEQPSLFQTKANPLLQSLPALNTATSSSLSSSDQDNQHNTTSSKRQHPPPHNSEHLHQQKKQRSISQTILEAASLYSTSAVPPTQNNNTTTPPWFPSPPAHNHNCANMSNAQHYHTNYSHTWNSSQIHSHKAQFYDIKTNYHRVTSELHRVYEYLYNNGILPRNHRL